MDYSAFWTKLYLNIGVIKHYFFVWNQLSCPTDVAVRFMLNFAVKVDLKMNTRNYSKKYTLLGNSCCVITFLLLPPECLHPVCSPLSFTLVVCHWSPAVTISSSWSISLHCNSTNVLSLLLMWSLFSQFLRTTMLFDELVSLVRDQEEEQRHTWAMFRVYRVHGRETNTTYDRETKEESGERNNERRRK